jgi:SAGA-associated factor 29
VYAPGITRLPTDPPTAKGQDPSESVDAEIEELLRENLRLTEEIAELNITDKLQILAALRNSNEAETVSTSRATSVGKSQRDRPNKRKPTESLDDQDSVVADSPVASQSTNPIANPSPKVMIQQKDRLIAKTGSRAGSVPMRESSVKAEDGGDDTNKGKKKRSSSSRRGGF